MLFHSYKYVFDASLFLGVLCSSLFRSSAQGTFKYRINYTLLILNFRYFRIVICYMIQASVSYESYTIEIPKFC